MKDPNLPRWHLALGHGLQPPEPWGHGESCWCRGPLCELQVKNKKLLPFGETSVVCAAEKTTLEKSPVHCSSSSFPAVLPSPVSIPMPSPRVCWGAAVDARWPEAVSKETLFVGAWEEAQHCGPASANSSPMGCGSGGGVPLEPSQAAPPEQQAPNVPAGGEIDFPRKRWSLCVVDAGGRLPLALGIWGPAFLDGGPSWVSQHHRSQLFGSSPLAPSSIFC